MDDLTRACSNIIDLVIGYASVLDISTALISLNIAKYFHKEEKTEIEEKFAMKILKSLIGTDKLSSVAAGALRLYINCSSNQYRNLKTFLHAVSMEYQNPSFDFLPNEKDLRQEDNASLPGNVSYTIYGPENNVLYTHDAKVLSDKMHIIKFLIFSVQIEEPHDIEDALAELGPLFFKPRIKGRYYRIPDVISKELQCLASKMEEGYDKLGLSSSNVAIVKIKIRFVEFIITTFKCFTLFISVRMAWALLLTCQQRENSSRCQTKYSEAVLPFCL